MKAYEITYMEQMYYTFYVEAASEEEAKRQLYSDPNKFDWSDGECYDSEIVSCEEVKKNVS